MRVLMAAPIEPRGRYRGGISSIANAIIEQGGSQLAEAGITIEEFDTCRVSRRSTTAGRLRPENVINSIRIARELLRAIHQSQPDLLYYHSSAGIPLLKDLLILHVLKRRTGTPIAVHVHYAGLDGILTTHWAVRALITHLLRRDVDRVIFLSERTMEEFRDIDVKNGSLLYNFQGVDLPRANVLARLEETRSRASAQLLFLGSIDKRKGILDLLEVLSRIDNNFTLHVCGEVTDDSIRSGFEARIRQLGDRVVWHGYVDGVDKRRRLLEADVLVLPSYAEGLPVSILEAMAAGCSVVSSRVGSTAEILGDSALMFEPGDKQGMFSALSLLLDDRELMAATQRSNYEKSSEFTLHHFLVSLIAIFDLAVHASRTHTVQRKGAKWEI